MKATQVDEDGKFDCPYGCDKKYDTLVGLEQHIERSEVGVRGTTEEHESGKIADGWYHPEWRQDKRTHERIESRRAYERKTQGFMFIDKHDYPQLRIVDKNPNVVITVAGGLANILRNAKDVTRRAAEVEKMARASGISTGQKPSAEQLSQISKAMSNPQMQANKTVFKTGQGFNPKEFQDRLSEPSKTALDQQDADAALAVPEVEEVEESF